MATFEIFKETALPGTLTPNGIYLITTSNPNHMELYVADNTGAAARRILNEADIQVLINASLGGIGSIEVVADIAARDALVLTSNTQVLVLDASADPTVDSGAATYVYQLATTSFIKISEAEGLDVSLAWANITGGPASTPAQIDAAVGASHTHANKTELDKVGEDGDGDMTYDGVALVQTANIAW